MHLEYLRMKAELWDARDRDDAEAEAEVGAQLQQYMYPRLKEVVLG